MKNLFKKKINPTAPRAFKEIEQEYQMLSAQAANAQYKVFVHSEELKKINKRLMEVNQEAAERQKLDELAQAEAAKAETPKEEPKNG